MKQLLLDLAGISDDRCMRETVSERLASYGEVTSLKVMDLPERDSRIILITMNSPQAATSAINGLGLRSFGECSLIITVPNGQD